VELVGLEMKIIYVSDAARENLRRQGLAVIDGELSKLSAREKLETFRQTRRRTFETPADANAADREELRLLNELHREFYRQ
jgi:hypothetical protein